MGDLDDNGEDGVQCAVCMGELLSQQVCFLRCGHVYHTSCCEQWFDQGKSECPLCKKPCRRDQLRNLDFEMAEVPMYALAELGKLRKMSTEERGRVRQEALASQEESRRAIAASKAERDVLKNRAIDHKRKRHELEAELDRTEAEKVDLHEELYALIKINSDLQASVDTQRQNEKLPFAPSSRDDSDVKEERKKLRLMRPEDRLLQLHQALLAARQLLNESTATTREREASLQTVERAIAELKSLETKLAQELRELKDQKQRRELAARALSRSATEDSLDNAAYRSRLSIPSPSTASASTEALSQSSHTSAKAQRTDSQVAVPQVQGNPQEKANLMRKGGQSKAPLRTALFTAAPAAPASSAGGKFGALFGPGARKPVPNVRPAVAVQQNSMRIRQSER